jgi:signal transduction histidine kinase
MVEAGGIVPRWRRAVAATWVIAIAALWVFATVLAGLDALPGLASVGFAVVGAVLLVRRPENRLAWVFLAMAATSAVLGSGGVYAQHALAHGWPGGRFVAWLADFMASPTIGLVAGVLPQLFPTGRALSARWRWPLLAAFGYTVFASVGNGFYPQRLESVSSLSNPYAIPAAKQFFELLITIAAPLGLVAVAGSLTSLVLRWRRATGVERQQLKWFAVSVCLLPIPLALHDVSNQITDAIISVLFVVIALAIGTAILRYRLYDLDLVISRTVGYLAVSAVVAGLYLAFVGVVEAATSGSVSLAVHVIAAVAAAAAFHPVRVRLQRAVDRLFYGDRARPYDAVAGLAQRLEVALDPSDVLPTIVRTVAGALRLPYVAIELYDGEDWNLAAEHGRASGTTDLYPMAYQGEAVGRMLVCARAPGEALDATDQRLLADLARQAGVAAQAARATKALLRSRAELVTAREEERRRLRRDLHDGLGPTLAGVTMGLHAARTFLDRDPAEAKRLLAGLEAQVEEAIADIRRLVYGLRPPALDEFGLVRALQLHASRMEIEPAGIDIVIDSPPDGLGRLPAAVEVAAYRIVTEALTNVTRHAAARTCTVRLCLKGALEVDVVDDGRGLDPARPPGVGVTAMRERATELGGVLSIEGLSPGTRVHARLPVPSLT